MSFQKLQIKLLSKSGELLNVVNCFAGQITVLRSNTITELHPYQRALSGIPGPERFSINIDGHEFKNEEHTLLGFGQNPLEPITLVQYLASFGVPGAAIKSVLLSYGLEQYAQESISSLGDCPKRRVQLLGATYTPDKVLILNNPFEPLSNEWKDQFAELVMTFAKNKNAIVVVTSLSYRPQSWIGNEQIARIQVGSNLQRTIGFGSEQSELKDVLAKVRAETQEQSTDSPLVHQQQASAPIADEQLMTGSQLVKRASSSWIGIAFGLCTIALLLGAGGLWYIKSNQEIELAKISQAGPSDQQQASNQTVADTQKPANTSKVETVVEAPQKKSASILPKPTEKTTELSPVLDFYDIEIKKAVLATFLGQIQKAPVSLTNSKAKTLTTAARSKSPKGFDLLNALETATGTGKGLPDSVPKVTNLRGSGATKSNVADGKDRPDFNSMSKDERRALLREKFRQAIERAQQRRLEQGN